MNFWSFLSFTTIGAGVWNCILAGLGYYLHTFVTKDELNSKIEEYSEYIKIAIILAVIIAIIYFVIKHYIGKKKLQN